MGKNIMQDSELGKAIAVAAELTGTVFSEAAVRIFAADLANYPQRQVLASLDRCRRELKGRLTLHDVISRIEDSDGRLGAEEAWALLPKREADTAVISEEMAQAFGVCHDLIEAGDMVAARMAFKESYNRAVASARKNHVPLKWFPSLGHDPWGLDGPLLQAAELGRISHTHVQSILPYLPEREAPRLGRDGDAFEQALKRLEH